MCAYCRKQFSLNEADNWEGNKIASKDGGNSHQLNHYLTKRRKKWLLWWALRGSNPEKRDSHIEVSKSCGRCGDRTCDLTRVRRTL